MNEMENKRKEFLQLLDASYKKLESFNKYSHPGFRKKVQRFLFNPGIYIPYISQKIVLFKKQEAKLFYGKKIKLSQVSPPFFSIRGILAGKAEYKLTRFFIKNLKEADVFYDIGANYGFYTYLALEFCKEVHSFEPIRLIFDTLVDNLGNHANVFLNNIALSDKKGRTMLYLPGGKGLDAMSGSSIMKESTQTHPYQFKKEVEIETDTLENYFVSHNFPTFIKMDVEGAESLVIAGGLGFFQTHSPIISLEVWSSKEGGAFSTKAVDLLHAEGYRSYFIDIHGDPEEVTGDLSIIVEKENLSCDNFLFKK